MKTVSIIVPVYKVEPFLRVCVDSIINQTYTNLEVILVDDGSPDNSGAICDEYAKKDARIKVIHKVNGGLSSARNAGLLEATGDYVCFFDSDDYINLDMIEKLVTAVEENDDDVCICGYSVDEYDANNNIASQKDVIPYFNYVKNDFSLSEYERILGWCGYAWNKLYKVSLLKENNFIFEMGISLVEDILFNSNVIDSGAKIRFISYVGYHYIQRNRETLGAKYYTNFFKLKKLAIEAKCTILRKWGVEENRVAVFYNNNMIDAVWGTYKNIQKSSLSKAEKKEKWTSLIKEHNLREAIKKIIPTDRRRKIKRLLLLYFK